LNVITCVGWTCVTSLIRSVGGATEVLIHALTDGNCCELYGVCVNVIK